MMLIRSINACESEATDFFRYGVWNLIGGGLGWRACVRRSDKV